MEATRLQVKSGLFGKWQQKAKIFKLPSAMPSGKPWPRISIVTASYNQGKYIEDTILSVLLQNYPNTEHIIIDAVSTDNTSEVLEKYKDQLAKVVIEPDKGQSSAINKGMKLATGDILTWLNSDDMLAPGALAAVAMAFDRSQADLVAGLCDLYKDGIYMASHLTSCPNGPLDVKQVLDMEHYWQAGMYFYQPEVMFTRRIWEKAGSYVNEDLHFCMDSELFLRFSKHKARLEVIGKPVAWFRLHNEQKTSNVNGSPDEFRRICRDFAKNENIDLEANNETEPAYLGCSLNIAMINDIGFRYGAGIAHKRLADSLSLAGHNVSHHTLGFYAGKTIKQRAKRIAEIISEVNMTDPDLIVCGNLHGFTGEPDFLEKLLKKQPVVLCLHDLWLLTGKCPHPFGCQDYLEGCGSDCSLADEYPVIEPGTISQIWKRKRDVLNNSKALLLSNSEWTQSMVKNVLDGTGPNCAKLSMGVSSEFSPYDKQKAREELKLPVDKFIILLASVNIGDKNKGIDALQKLDEIADHNMAVVSLGIANEELSQKYPWLIQLGHIDEPGLLARIFSAVDLHVSFSRTETLGQTFIEAAACATPSVGFRSTGIVDSIVDGLSGRLVDLDSGSIVEEVLRFKKDIQSCKNMGQWGAINAASTRSLYYEYHSFYRALYDSGLIPLEKLGRKISFLSNIADFPALNGTVRYSGMAPFLSSGWSEISSKGVLTTSRIANFNFSANSEVKHITIELDAHWSVNANIIKRFMAWGFYTFIRKDRGSTLKKIKRLFSAKRQPLKIKVLLNKTDIGKFVLRNSRAKTLTFAVDDQIIEEANILTFEIEGVSTLSEMGISSERRHLGMRLHQLSLKYQ